jgi:hypothetical protein
MRQTLTIYRFLYPVMPKYGVNVNLNLLGYIYSKLQESQFSFKLEQVQGLDGIGLGSCFALYSYMYIAIELPLALFKPRQKSKATEDKPHHTPPLSLCTSGLDTASTCLTPGELCPSASQFKGNVNVFVTSKFRRPQLGV